MNATGDEYNSSHTKLGFIGAGGQSKLSAAKILVIGAGGLGCPALVYLTGCGIGTIGIADFDTVALSNLHRQTLYTFNDIGQPKTTAAVKTLAAHNPFIEFNAHPLLVDESNILELVRPYDVVVDGTDNFLVRYLINDACVYLNKPLVYGAIYQQEGDVTVFNYRQSPTLRCLFPEPADDVLPGCSVVGAYNIITGMVGAMMANEVVKIILQHEAVLAGKLLHLDALTGKTFQLSYQAVPGSRQLSIEKFSFQHQQVEISPAALHQKISGRHPFQLIDVRTEAERTIRNIGGLHIPAEELPAKSLEELQAQTEIVLYCEQGSRSLSAAKLLRARGFQHVFSLSGGIKAYTAFGK